MNAVLAQIEIYLDNKKSYNSIVRCFKKNGQDAAIEMFLNYLRPDKREIVRKNAYKIIAEQQDTVSWWAD